MTATDKNFASAIETAFNAPKLFGQVGGPQPTTLRAAVETICTALSASAQTEIPESRPLLSRGAEPLAGFVGWGSALGSNRVPIHDVEQDFHLSSPVLAKSAGIVSICRASAGEDEVIIGKLAAQQALRRAKVSVQNLDWIIATSETFLGFPSLAASLHAALLASTTCQVLDVGGACIGLLVEFLVPRKCPGNSADFLATARAHSSCSARLQTLTCILTPSARQ